MDGNRFDALSRRLARRHSRRGALGGALSGLAALVGFGVAGAACPAGQYAGSGGRCLCKTTGRAPTLSGCPCGAGETKCGGVCRDLSRDVANCGSCDLACQGDTCNSPFCLGGTCLLIANPAAIGGPCDDGNQCTTDDTCQSPVAGVSACTGTSVACRPPGLCEDSVTCDPTSGNCVPNFSAPGTTCENPSPCFTGGTCDGAGACTGGTPTACPAPTECQVSVSCNPTSGACDQIVNRAPGFPCGSPASCIGGVQHTQDTCDGFGQCVPGTNTACAPFACGGTTCFAACVGPAECAPGATCLGSTCTPLGGPGAPCGSGPECQSGVCCGSPGTCCAGVCCDDGTCSASHPGGTCECIPFCGPPNACGQDNGCGSPCTCPPGTTCCGGGGSGNPPGCCAGPCCGTTCCEFSGTECCPGGVCATIGSCPT